MTLENLIFSLFVLVLIRKFNQKSIFQLLLAWLNQALTEPEKALSGENMIFQYLRVYYIVSIYNYY